MVRAIRGEETDDDNSDGRELLYRLYKNDTQREYLLFESHSAFEGLEVCQKESPDCILLDYRLPDLDGLEFFSKLSEIKDLQMIPVIMLTGQGSESIAVEAMKLGVQDYLVKDKITYEALQRVIHKAFETTDLLRKIENQHTQLEAFQKRILEELAQAQIAQLALLPQKLPDNSHVKIAAKFVPIDQVGGDFYDVFELDEGRIRMVIADVTGHGIPASFISSMTAGLFKTHAFLINSLASLLLTVNDALYDRIPEDKFTTAIYCTYKAQTQTLTYSSAGHLFLYILRTCTREVIALGSKGMMLGLFPSEINHFKEEQFKLLPGDKVIFYTDGIIEFTNSAKEMLGSEGLESVLRDNYQLSIEDLLETIYSEVLNFSNKSKFDDDITLLGLEIKGSTRS